MHMYKWVLKLVLIAVHGSRNEYWLDSLEWYAVTDREENSRVVEEGLQIDGVTVDSYLNRCSKKTVCITKRVCRSARIFRRFFAFIAIIFIFYLESWSNQQMAFEDMRYCNCWSTSCSNTRWRYYCRSLVLLLHTILVGQQALLQSPWRALASQCYQSTFLSGVTSVTCSKTGTSSNPYLKLKL